MKLITVKIHILSTMFGTVKLKEYDEVKDGKVKSTSERLNVNKADYGYSIIYDDEEFEELTPGSFVASLIKLFSENLPDCLPEFELLYHYDFDFTSIKDGKVYDEECFPDNDTLEMLIRINDIMEILSKNENSKFKYIAKNEFKELLEEELKRENYTEEYDDEDDEDEDEIDEIPSVFEAMGFPEFHRKSKHKKKNKEYYEASKILKNNKNPKKMINRHGVIVNTSKKAKKHDEKIIKNFLKDFIPGNAKWKRNLRKELTKRWLNDFMISKKKLKKLEKEVREKKKKKKNKNKTNLLTGIANNLLTKQSDNWFNPNK